VAAELWGVSVEQVMADVAAGRVPSRVEGEFIFVDVQPADTDQAERSPAAAAMTLPPYRRSLAWSVPLPPDGERDSIPCDPIVTPDERDALMDEPAGAEGFDDNAWDDVDADAEDAVAAEAEDAGDESDVDAPDEPIVLTADDVPNWGEVRSRVARTRKPPRRILDAA
jgi:hypothetical protein